METETISVGSTVTGVPVGQRRRQTFVVTRIDQDETDPGMDLLVGLLVSRKYPGDYRGGCVAYRQDCVVS